MSVSVFFSIHSRENNISIAEVLYVGAWNCHLKFLGKGDYFYIPEKRGIVENFFI